MKNEFFGLNKYVFPDKMNTRLLVCKALVNGTLNRDLDIIQQVLIAQHRYPEGDRLEQQREIKSLTKSFQALLHAKARQERVQEIGYDYCSSSENCGASPADNTPRRIRIGDVLKKKISGGRKRNKNSRKKEGYVESRLGKHETKGW
jgi:hypothetical protein